MKIICKISLLFIVLILTPVSSANIFFPDGGGNHDPQIEKMASEAAAAFLKGVAATYDMLSNVEVKDFNGARGQLKVAIKEFEKARKDCENVKKPIASSKTAIASLAERKSALGEELRVKYVNAQAIPDERTKWNKVLRYAINGQLDELVGLCVNSANNMIQMLIRYQGMLHQQGGPTLVENWKIANQIETELQTLRYAAILVEGPIKEVK